jgi:hypothetical protein
MKSEAIFGYFLVAALLVLVFFINTVISSTLLEQKNDWIFNTSTRDTSPRALVGSDTGYSLTAGQRLNVSWDSEAYGMGAHNTHSMRFYLLNSSQIGGWRWVVTGLGQYEETNSGFLIKLDNWTTTVTCLINSTGTYYVIFVCDGVYNPIDYFPAIYVHSYAAYVSSPPTVSISPGSVAIDLGQSQLFTSTVSGGTSPYSYQWYLCSGVVLGNTVVNPGFETGNSTGWNQEGPNNASIRSDINHTGSYCCASPYIGSQYLPFKITQKLPNVPSNIVTNVSCWRKWGNTASDWLKVNYTDGSVSSVALGISSSWTYVTLNLAANKTVDSLILERNASQSSIICIDDVEFSVGGFPVSGATGPTWTFTPSSLGSYTVYVQVTDNAGFTVNSNFATVTVNPVPSVTISPSSVVMDVGQSQLFTSNVTGGTSPYSYQWYLNGGQIAGANSSSWVFTPPSEGSYIQIYVRVTDSVGVQAISNTTTVTVNSRPSVSISPSSVVMDVNQSQLFTSTVSGGTSPYSYQWYLNDAPVSGPTDANWTFISSSAGSYAVYVNATDNVGVQATSNIANITVKFHDVAVTNVASSKTVVGQGFSARINVTVANQGGYTETFNVTVYANTTIIDTLTSITLTSEESTTITFTWNTTGFAYGNYTISAYAWPVPDETDTEDNTLPDGWVLVTIPGDVNGDFKCEGKDIAIIAKACGTRAGQAGYVSNADINDDGKIDGKDIAVAAKYYGTHYP